MDSFQEQVEEYRRQVRKGTISKAYRGLIEYVMELRTYFEKNRADYAVSGSIYQGYMDMTYFSVVPEVLKRRKLKIAIVFLHEAFRFEVWLAAANKAVQAHYWKVIKDSGWTKYRLVPDIQGADSILESVLVDAPDFSDRDALMRCIETATLGFITDVESFLSKH